MPSIDSRAALAVARDLKVYLQIHAGVTRGSVPDPEGKLDQARRRIKDQSRRIERLRGRSSGGRRLRGEDAAGRGGFEHQVHDDPLHNTRREIAYRYLSGDGLEIGGLHAPLEVPPTARVRYVDRMTVDELRQHHPELSEYKLVPVDIVDDGETLPSVADGSVDFLIANHMLEHCQNPIATIENHLRALKPGGIYFLVVPDKRFTFDEDRPLTPLQHVARDYEEGPEWSANAHFEEWARMLDKVPEDEVSARASHLAEVDASIHFHVWTQVELLEMLLYCRKELGFPFEIELFQKNHIEVVALLRKE